MENNSKIDLNPEFKRALALLEDTQKNVFVTGRAGTGKSTLLRYFRDHTKKNIVVLAPTGVAAITIHGQTIHSFFHFKPNVTLNKIKRVKDKNDLYHKLDAIVIDEISMVRADLLDCVDRFLRLNGPDRHRPFGGIQMIFIGDLYQLPPVVTSEDNHIFLEHYESPYFFSAHVFRPEQQTMLVGEPFTIEFIELEKMYRQSDLEFIRLLNSIRDNTATSSIFATLNTRHDPLFDPSNEEMYIHLTTTNAMAEEVNSKRLSELKGDVMSFIGTKKGKFDQKYLPTTPDLDIKIGAQIMLLNNDSQGRWINGTIGQVLDVEDSLEGPKVIIVELEDGTVESVAPYSWDIYEYSFNQSANAIESESVGSFTQYPMKLAWAVTIHKSQGKTFDRLIIDIGRGTFSAGQLYVALSRATTLEGIILKKPVAQRHIWLDKKVALFVENLKSAQNK